MSTEEILNTWGTCWRRSSPWRNCCRCLPPCRGCSSHCTPGWGSPEPGDCTLPDMLPNRLLISENWTTILWLPNLILSKDFVLLLQLTVSFKRRTLFFGASSNLCICFCWLTISIEDVVDELRGVRGGESVFVICLWGLGQDSWLYLICPSSTLALQWPPGIHTPSTSFRTLRLT